MSSKTVQKVVAKKLKYYLDVKRREDAFDLSGPYLPAEDPNPLRAGPTLAYDGIHDRSLKHYYRDNNIKKQLQHMKIPQNMHRSREKTIRRYVDTTMASVDYRLKAGPISPYAFPQTVHPRPPPHRPKALMTVDEYFRTRKGSKRRKTPVHIVGKPRRISRRSPPQHIDKNERERLVNMASKLIVATETVALPQQKMQSKGFQANEEELPPLQSSSRRHSSTTESPFTSGHESESSHDAMKPAPPKNKPSSAHRRRPQSSFFKSSSFESPGKSTSGVHVVLPAGAETDTDKIKYLMDRMNLDGRGTSVMASPRQVDSRRPKSAIYPSKSEGFTSTGVNPIPSPYEYDDDFYSDEDSPHPASSPKMSWMEGDHEKIDMSTQTVVHSGTQTRFTEVNDEPKEREVFIPSKLSWADRGTTDAVDSRPPVAVATSGAATVNEPTNTATEIETQTRNRDLEPKVITYEVYIKTGDRLGAGTKATVKITIFGEYGNSGERQLLRSKTHRSKFQRGQVDVFAIDSLFLGKILSVRVGHNETRLGYGWFLDKVYVKEGVDATRAFEFKCNRWFSSRDDDGQVMRDLPVYDVVPASHVAAILPKVVERQDDQFFSPSDSETTQSEGEETPREYEPRPRETRHSKAKTKAKKSKPKPKAEVLDEEGGFKPVPAENLFEVSDEENDNDKDNEEDRFFEPSQEASGSEHSDEEVVDRKPPKNVTNKPPPAPAKKPSKVKHLPKLAAVKKEKDKSSSSEEERAKSGEEEREEEEKEKEEEEQVTPEEPRSSEEESKPKPGRPKGTHHLRLVTTAVSPFLKSRAKKQPSPIAEEPSPETPRKPEPEVTQDRDESDEEPQVEFTPTEKKKAERPTSAHSTHSEDFEEGFRAGIRKKQEEERMKHRASISESENVFRTGPSIHDAAKKGDLARIKELIGVAPAMKSVPDEKGMTALHIASSNGHLDCVKWLAVSGVDLGQETPTGYTAIHLAAMGGHVNCMMILSAMGSVVNCKTVDDQTPLHLAAMSGHLECVKWLLANRSRTEAEDSNGRTALDIAEEYGHEDIVKLLKKFKKELTRQDSTLAQLMTAEKKRRKSNESMVSDNDGAPSKVSDSGVGGMESEEDNWISDAEDDNNEDGVMKDRRTESKRAPDRPDSASRSRTDSIVSAEEKKMMFDKQRMKMKKRNSSFLDSIRMDVENDEEEF
ncbi:predicted protein [Nematostella vectensis]|uniref:PLAT domain-containing protein n=1 Tax=Nematostella vectensis TaxID=45351 RepID=A7RYU3_NEMVE|nr:uncharacterized protein LOC5515317 isoform X2 [Nematostella vectensis]EDO43381.1 predicted protein [Nematostella vectensis]|eukprot:XP_001635444.1 predicted protein [Nematostella vectensis]